jgi:hypothetical protein
LGKLNIRFDLCSKLPSYKNIVVKPAFFDLVIARSFSEKKSVSGLKVKVPDKVDEALIRYIDFHEYFYQRPDKIKHVEWINKELKKDQMEMFFNRLHYLIQFPYPSEDTRGYFARKINSFRYLISLSSNAIQFFKSHGFKPTFEKIKRRLIK